MRENGCDSTLPRPTRFSLILQSQSHATTTNTMRNVEYITNGFGLPSQVMPVPAYIPPSRLTLPSGFTDLGYIFSPSGGGFGAGGGGRVYNLQDRFGDLVSRMVPYGLNPRFLDIVRGPGGRGYLDQTIRLVNAYKSNLRRYGYNINAAYNNSVAIAGGESFLMPRAFLTNRDLISFINDGDILNWLKTVRSAL